MDKEKKKPKANKEQEYLDGWKRAKADYDNLVKQLEKERLNHTKFANTNLIMGLIPVYENLKLSFEHLPEDIVDNPWVKGIEHVKAQFKQVLEFNNVSEIEPKEGDELNLELHEVISSGKEDKKTIKKVISTGYTLSEKVIIPAKVETN